MSFMFMFMYSDNLFMLMVFFGFLNLMNKNFLTVYMFFMTFILMKMIFFSMKEKMNSYYFSMKKNIIKLMFIMMLVYFSMKKLIFLYIFFEMISLMMFILIFFSSFSFMRLKASIYMFLFMGVGTFPMLCMIFFFDENLTLILFSLSFLIKIPIIFFHLWLPKAHVEANYYDSMILASLLLKLGGYGILMMDLNEKLNFIFLWSLTGTTLVSFLVLFLLDVKMIMALSSIIHMNMMILMMMNNCLMLEKSFSLLMLSHAISSSLMFFMVGLIYEQSFSRSMLINKNHYLNFMLFFVLMFFVLLSNMGTPPFLTFFSELYVYMYMLNYSNNYFIMLMLMILLTMMFNLILLKNMGMMIMNKFYKMFNMKLNSMILIKEHFFYLLNFY